MLRMMKLDWSAMKYYHIRFLIVSFSLFVIGWYSPVYLVPMGVILLFFYSVNPFAVEEKGDLHRFYLTLPVKRGAIVRGRYALSFVAYLIGAALGAVLMPLENIISFSKWYPDYKWMLALFSFSFLLFGLMSLAMYPLLFKLGYQKGKMWGYYLPVIVISLIYIAVLEYDTIIRGGLLITGLLVYAAEHILAVSGGMFVLGAVLLGISYTLSVRIYEKREF